MSVPGGGAVTQETAASGASASWPEVVRTAYLLTMDHGTAEELAAAAFVQQRRRRLPPSPDVVRQLVLTLPSSLARQLVARTRRRPDPGDPFVAAYLGLSARQRALLVVRLDDGLDGPAAAAMLGLRPAQARELTAAALDTLRAAPPVVAAGPSQVGGDSTDRRLDPPAADELDLGELTPSDREPPADPLPGDPVVPRLAAVFAELSAAPPVVADPARRVDEAAALARRRRARLAVVAVCLVAIVAGSGALLGKRRADDLAQQERAERRRAAEAALNPVVQGGDVATWPTRGSLAGRGDLVAQVRAAAQREDAGVVLGVPFMGEVAGLDVALAITEGSDGNGRPERRLVALFGPRSQPVSSWQRTVDALDADGPEDLPVPVLSAALSGEDGQIRTVVVTVSSGVSFAVSPRLRIDPDGVPTRRYTTVPLRNGVGTMSWRGALQGAMTRVQYRDQSPSFGHTSLAWWPEDPPTDLRGKVRDAASCRGAPFTGLRLNADDAGRNAAAMVGLWADEVAQVQVVGCRRVGKHVVMILGVRAVDGTALQTSLEEVHDGGGSMSSSGGIVAVPRNREATHPLYVRLMDPDQSSGFDRRTVVFAAPGGATAELVREPVEGAGRVLVKARLGADGLGVGRAAAPLDDLLETDQGPLFVVVRDAAGRQLERVPAPGGDDLEPETLDGPVDPPADGPAFPHRR
jgi:hypothetical protein